MLTKNPALFLPDLRMVFEAIPAALLLVLPDVPVFTIVAASDAYLRAACVRREDLLNQGLFEIFPDNPDNFSGSGVRNIRASFECALQTRIPHELSAQRYDIRRPLDAGGGFEERYWRLTTTPVLDEDDSVKFLLQGVEDVTDTVRTEEHDRYLLQLEDSDAQFRTLAESIPQLAWMADNTGHIFWYNRRWYDYTGTTFDEMRGWGWQKVHDPAVLPSVLEQWSGAISSGKSFDMTFPLRGADGVFRSFLTRVEPVKNSQQEVIRWFGTNTDVTEQKRTENELRRMNRELEEFAYVASHDLQEPLRMVGIYTQLLLRQIGETKDTKLGQYATFVRQGINRMDALIRDLLMFSRTVQPSTIPDGTADLSASLSIALSVLKSQIEDSEATITFLPLPSVQADTNQIAHVFQNLLSNSLKYRKINIFPEIAISATQEGDKWVVSVRDNGIGFEQQYAQQIFGLFKRLHKDEYAGTGLGLAICQRIVERYGGRMWAEGRPENGATFYFSLRSAKTMV